MDDAKHTSCSADEPHTYELIVTDFEGITPTIGCCTIMIPTNLGTVNG